MRAMSSGVSVLAGACGLASARPLGFVAGVVGGVVVVLVTVLFPLMNCLAIASPQHQPHSAAATVSHPSASGLARMASEVMRLIGLV